VWPSPPTNRWLDQDLHRPPASAPPFAETLQLIARWLTADPATLALSLLAHIGHPAYGLDALRADLDRFTFLLGGSDGEHLFEAPPE
jgi:hypothetical protein